MEVEEQMEGRVEKCFLASMEDGMPRWYESVKKLVI